MPPLVQYLVLHLLFSYNNYDDNDNNNDKINNDKNLVVHLLSSGVFVLFALLPSIAPPPLPALLVLFLVFGLSWGQIILLISTKITVCELTQNGSNFKYPPPCMRR